MELKGYVNLRVIYENEKIEVYKGTQENGAPVIIKTLRSLYPEPQDLEQLEHEYRVAKKLDIPGVVKPCALENAGHSKALIWEDFGGMALNRYMKSHAPSLKNILEIMKTAAGIIDDIHRNNIIHKDIKPHNIIVNPNTLEVRITDFSIAAEVQREIAAVTSPGKLEGTLAYIAPEQTGRTNRSIDFRSDYYSFGITFYELLTGRLPFETDDKMELVHSHIAVIPVPPGDVNPSIPRVLSNIVMKLVAKTAEERYQGIFGLLSDLEECHKQLKELGTINDFNIGENDIPEVLRVPEKLYGREKEIRHLMELFSSAVSGNREIVYYSGEPGIGKTALINEVHKPIVEKRGTFISGKYDQYNRDIPYSAIIQAFEELSRKLLAETEGELLQWKERILQAVGKNGRVIIDVIPGIELIIGKQPEVQQQPPLESQNRFNQVFQDFIKVFPREDHPLVIFLDDLQWADNASLQLMELFLSDPGLNFILFIGAYRDTEVDSSHPFVLMQERMSDVGSVWEELTVMPLARDHINLMLSDSLHCGELRAVGLSGLILEKTGGNPFFVKEFVKALYSEGLVEFTQGWTWDIGRIEHAGITDNVVELMTGKILKLPERCLAILKTAACIGVVFDLTALSLVYGKSEHGIFEDIKEAINEGLLLKIEDLYKFVHDKVQEAAYILIDEEERKKLHYKIGTVLYDIAKENKTIDENIFSIVTQFDQAKNLIKDENKQEYIELIIKAGQKAKDSAAYVAAADLLKNGLELLHEDSWKENYDLMLTLHDELAEAEYLARNYEKFEELYEVINKNAKRVLDKITISKLEIDRLTNQLKHNEAIETGRKLLKEFNYSLPKNPGKISVFFEIIKTKTFVNMYEKDSFLNKPAMVDKRIYAIITIFIMLGSSSYNSRPKLMLVMLLRGIRLFTKYGTSELTPYVYIIYGGVVIAAIFGEIEHGYKIGKVALELSNQSGIKRWQGRCLFQFSYISHLKEHHRENLNHLVKAAQYAYEAGDFLYVAFSYIFYFSVYFFMGEKLSAIKKEYDSVTPKMKKLKQPQSAIYYSIWRQIVLNLLGESEDKILLKGEAAHEEEFILLLKESDDKIGFGHYYVSKMILYYIYNDYSAVVTIAANNEENITAAMLAFPYVPVFYFFYALGLSALCIRSKKRKYLKKLKKIHKMYEKWGAHNKYNYLHKYYLISAELAQINGEIDQACKFYDKSIKTASVNGCMHEEAIANECAARFYLQCKDEGKASVYMTEAYNCYRAWGAKPKQEDMLAKYPALIKAEAKEKIIKENIETATERLSGTVTRTGSEELDYTTIMKASQVLSGEIVLSKLLAKLMSISIENAGAEKAYLLLKENNELFVKAEGKTMNEEVSVLESISMESHGELPVSIINYVVRMQETLLLNDAAGESIFITDPFVLENKPKSILCIPIIHRGELTGILYLKNDLSTGAFTPERQKVLQVIANQAAISIENARLYKDMEENNKRLQELDTLKDEFLANTSHELKTPLNGIIGLADSMIGTEKDAEPKIARDNLSLIVSSGKRLSNLINDILDFSKLRNNDIRLNVKAVDIRSLVDVVLELSTPLLGGKNLKLVNAIDPEMPPAKADENRIEQVLFNIVGNAIKFTESGTITVKAAFERTGGGKAGEIKITVSDTGIGIPVEKQQGIFQSFEQADGSLSREYGGTGLGLSIVKQLVELHGGSIRVESKEGKGSDFIFTLPAGEAGNSENYTAPQQTEFAGTEKAEDFDIHPEDLPIGEDYTGQKGRILVVDDDPVNLRVIRSYLLNENYTVIYAKSGQGALDKLREKQSHKTTEFDLVLLDLMMPKMPGYEVCRRIREIFALYDLPVIMLTARNRVEDLVAGFGSGANDYIAKPFNKEELLSRVETLVTLKKTVKEHKEAKFKLLQERMSPHYLFNSLNVVRSLIKQNSEKAEESVVKLSENYRFITDKSNQSLITFEEEWKFIENYLDMEKIRYGDRLTIDMERRGDFSRVNIPPLILQPLVENCLKHGLARGYLKGYIKVFAKIDDNIVEVEILDNGAGINKEDIYSRSLGNILKRLKYRFDNAVLEAHNREEGGARIYLSFGNR
ncbi:MAG: AAA family ATPase [bacterium]|nr:AAA family ATPase [bacterium]